MDAELPEEDLSMRSFQERFDQLDINENANMSIRSFKKSKQQEDESERVLN